MATPHSTAASLIATAAEALNNIQLQPPSEMRGATATATAAMVESTNADIAATRAALEAVAEVNRGQADADARLAAAPSPAEVKAAEDRAQRYELYGAARPAAMRARFEAEQLAAKRAAAVAEHSGASTETAARHNAIQLPVVDGSGNSSVAPPSTAQDRRSTFGNLDSNTADGNSGTNSDGDYGPLNPSAFTGTDAGMDAADIGSAGTHTSSDTAPMDGVGPARSALTGAGQPQMPQMPQSGQPGASGSGSGTPSPFAGSMLSQPGATLPKDKKRKDSPLSPTATAGLSGAAAGAVAGAATADRGGTVTGARID